MTELEAAMARLLAAQRAVDEADAQREAAMRKRDDALREASAAGATYVAIREATSMSPSTISKALRRQ
jgi:hypothetical protein